MSQTNKSVLIVGSGIGGISTAIFLARSGYEVSIFEKNSMPGGRCGHIIRDGHRFDLGATIVTMPSVYRSVFESMGLSFDECFEVTKLLNIIKIHFDNGEKITFSTNQNKMQEQLEEIEPGSYKKLLLYISEGYRFFQIAIEKLLGRNFYNLFSFINLKNLLLLIKLKSYIRHYTYAGRFFKHPHLKMAFTYQNIYVGQSPYTAPAFFSMLSSVELTDGSLFVKGGMFRIVEKLISIASGYGVRFYFNRAVERINVSDNKTNGILLEDGIEVTGDIVIANADLPYVYNNLLPDRNAADKINKFEYACSAIVLHWGLDKVFPQLEQHSVFLAENYKECMHKIFIDKTSGDPPSFYVHSPTRTDATAAPQNQDSLTIVIPVGHIDQTRNQDWVKLKNELKTSIIERLKKEGLEDIDQHIKFEICYLPNTWKSIYNISKGSVFGSLSHTISQMGYFRPHNRHDRYKNLYFVGGSTQPGNGIPLVLLSAKLVSERIIRDDSNHRQTLTI